MKNKDIYMYSLGALIAIGFFVLLYILMYVEIKPTNRDVLNLVVGALIGSFTTVVSYFFGSSKGSADKTDKLHEKAIKS